MERVGRRVLLVAVSSLLVVAVACGEPNDEMVEPPAGAPAGTASTAPEPTTTVEPMATVAPMTTPTESTTAATTTAAPTTTLPGEPVDWLIAGTVAQVPGVAFDETFVIRRLPGEDQPAAASLPPLTELVLTGNGRDLDQGTFFITWAEVTAGGVTGWISLWSLVYLGAPSDVTATTVSEVGVWPVAPTMLALGKIVTDAIVPSDPDFPPPDIVVVAEPSAGTTSEVVYDAFPGEAFGDDTSFGSRIWVTGRQVPAGDLPATGFASSLVYELVSVEATSLCTRGVDPSTGFCV